MIQATHLIYAIVALIGVFAIAVVAGPSQAAGPPMAAVILACDPTQPQPCPASTGDLLAEGDVRVS